jgi:hypothetical protein
MVDRTQQKIYLAKLVEALRLLGMDGEKLLKMTKNHKLGGIAHMVKEGRPHPIRQVLDKHPARFAAVREHLPLQDIDYAIWNSFPRNYWNSLLTPPNPASIYSRVKIEADMWKQTAIGQQVIMELKLICQFYGRLDMGASERSVPEVGGVARDGGSNTADAANEGARQEGQQPHSMDAMHRSFNAFENVTDLLVRTGEQVGAEGLPQLPDHTI